MKLAEALIEKKDLKVRIVDLQIRYTTAAIVESGETGDEETTELLQSLDGAMLRLEELTVAVNVTNNSVPVGEITMMQAIAHRDILKMQVGQYRNIVTAIQGRNTSRHHYGGESPKMVLTEGVNAANFIKKVDALSKELRILDAAMQAANWASDLIA
jgi:hypothetical protein